MKQFKTNSNNLLKGLTLVSGVVGSNNTLPILDNFLFELNGNILNVTGTDLENTIITTLDIESDLNESITIPSKTFLDVLKTFNNETLVFTIAEGNTLLIQSGSGKYELPYDSANDYPNTPQLSDSQTETLNANELLRGITKTLFATSTDDLRPIMTGIYFDSGKFVSTDAHKLVKVDSNFNANFILPKKSANLLKNALVKDSEVELSYNSTNAIFKMDNVIIVSRLIDGKFPNYDAVIPKNNDNRLSINRVEFLKVLKRVGIFSNKQTSQIRLTLNDEVKISAEDIDFKNKAVENLQGIYNGSPLEIGFNAKFLIEMLNNMESTDVHLDMSEPNKAGLIRGEDNFLGLVMPVMLNAK